MRRLPPLAAIRAFEAAARTENFTAAAAELGMTQAAVSYQVKSLEERLGSPLFVREKGRARLTPLGARLLPALSGALDAIEAAFASHREEDESLLTITTTHTFANTWLAWRLGAFQMEHPDLAVRMTTSNELCDLRAGDADVAIRGGRGGWEGMEEHKLFESTFTPMASPECIAEVERKLGRELEPRRHPDQNPSIRATTGGSNGSPTMASPPTNRCFGARASGSRTRPTKAMRRWPGRVLPADPAAVERRRRRRPACVPFPDRISARGWAYWLVFPRERRLVPQDQALSRMAAPGDAGVTGYSREFPARTSGGRRGISGAVEPAVVADSQEFAAAAFNCCWILPWIT